MRAKRSSSRAAASRCAVFTSAITAADGASVSSENVRGHIVRFIQAEDPRKPLSDEALRAALEAVQLPVSRRTVAKYREETGHPVLLRPPPGRPLIRKMFLKLFKG